MNKIILIIFIVLFASCSKKEGCITDTACNFDSSADIDNGSCEYAEEFYDCDGFFAMVTVPAGDYTYGENDEILSIDYDFEMMQYEVTNSQYLIYLEEALANGNISVNGNSVQGYYEGDENTGAGNHEYLDLDDSDCEITYSNNEFIVDIEKENHPVIEVSWYGANAFALHYGMRLPTEYEWEKTARSNTGADYPWGDNSPTCDLTNYSGCIGWTQEVGITTGISPYGAYDMAGNVWEWTDSWYNSSIRVLRGGSWNTDTNILQSWYRSGYNPYITVYNSGFRCLRTL